MRPELLLASLLTLLAPALHAQWQILDAHTTSDLRGVDNVGHGIVWASGTNGTVLRSLDDGNTWTHCPPPPGADKLDFRGIQAFDASTAIVMSSGKGDLSRLYKTTDGCKSWKLIATNPDKDGFWDAVTSHDDGAAGSVNTNAPSRALVLGDSVDGKIKLWEWKEGSRERELEPSTEVSRAAEPAEASFAASNSVLQVATTPQIDPVWKYDFRWASNTPTQSFISYVRAEHTSTCEPCPQETGRATVPLSRGSDAAGIFSFIFRTEMSGVAVGGDYKKPAVIAGTAAFTADGGLHWTASTTTPHGYRSAVAYDDPHHTWITVGPNGTDISTDDGRNWQALKPSAADAPGADRDWNALSLPFVVGPHGRIGKLRTDALPTPRANSH